MSPRPSRAAAAAAEKKIKRDIEEILLPSDVKENYHRADLAVRMATKNGKDMPSCHRNTTSTILKTDDVNDSTQQQPRNKKAKTATSTTIPTKSEKTPPPPRPLFNSTKNNVMDIDIADAVENEPTMGRATAMYVSKTLEYDEMGVMFSPLYPKAIDFIKRVRRHG